MEWMFMPLKRYAEFSGRSRPRELWMFALLQLIIYITLFILTLVIGAGFAGFASTGGNNPNAAVTGLMGMVMAMGVFALVYLLVYLVFFIPNLAVSARRLHDTGRSGWWVMLYFGPWLMGVVISIVNAGAQSQGLVGINLLLSALQLLAIVVLIVFWCLPGTPGPNEYGDDPMGGAGNLGETFA